MCPCLWLKRKRLLNGLKRQRRIGTQETPKWCPIHRVKTGSGRTLAGAGVMEQADSSNADGQVPKDYYSRPYYQSDTGQYGQDTESAYESASEYWRYLVERGTD